MHKGQHWWLYRQHERFFSSRTLKTKQCSSSEGKYFPHSSHWLPVALHGLDLMLCFGDWCERHSSLWLSKKRYWTGWPCVRNVEAFNYTWKSQLLDVFPPHSNTPMLFWKYLFMLSMIKQQVELQELPELHQTVVATSSSLHPREKACDDADQHAVTEWTKHIKMILVNRLVCENLLNVLIKNCQHAVFGLEWCFLALAAVTPVEPLPGCCHGEVSGV